MWEEQDARELSTEEIKKGLDILRQLGVVEVVLSGGNPLLRDDIGKIIDYASRFFITTVYDNGSMAVQKINDLRNADFVAISIDTLDSEKSDYLKGVKGSLEKAIESVETLQNEGISVSVSPTISQFNLHEIVRLTRYFLEKNVPIWYCLYSYDISDPSQLFRIGRKNDDFTITDGKAASELFETLNRLKKTNDKILMTSQMLNAMKNLYATGKKTWKCRALRNFFVVDHLGRVAGCHLHDPQTTIFDLPKSWNSQTFDRLRNSYQECNQCTYMCYIFYSLHSNVFGNLQIARQQWKNAKLVLRKRTATHQY